MALILRADILVKAAILGVHSEWTPASVGITSSGFSQFPS
jgi:hypothetical protein